MFTVYILSDSSGETAELVAKSALSQFKDQQVEIVAKIEIKKVEI